MAGCRIKVYTDEHIDTSLAGELRRRGYDVVSCHEAGRANQGISDPQQRAHAAGEGRAILTNNTRDYLPLDARWKRQGRVHAGIMAFANVPPTGELLRRVMTHLDTFEPHEQHNIVLWI